VRNLTQRSKSVGSLITLLALFSFLLLPAFASAQTVNLTWQPSNSQNIVGYNVYRGNSPDGPYTKLNSTLDPNTAYSDSTVQAGKTYYYVTTAVDNQGVESAYSNQSEAVIPGGGSGSENSLYSFAGGNDPRLPFAGLIFDAAGNLYGTTSFGGSANGGAAFKLSPNMDGSWAYSSLYVFQGNPALNPYGGLAVGSAGTLYGMAARCSSGCKGVVYQITP